MGRDVSAVLHATGIIMGLWRCDAAVAFGDLMRVSREHHYSVYNVAATLVSCTSSPYHTTQPEVALEAIVHECWVDQLPRPNGRLLGRGFVPGLEPGVLG